MLEEILLCDGFSLFGFLLQECLKFFFYSGLANLSEHNGSPLSKLAVIACLALLQALRVNRISFVRMLLIPASDLVSLQPDSNITPESVHKVNKDLSTDNLLINY